MSSIFYDGTKLLSMLDLDGNKPEIYVCTSNRTSGKTVFFSRYFVNRFLKNREKFCILYRYSYEIDDCDSKFFKDIEQLFFKGHTMKAEKRARGLYAELFLDEKSCGYALSINNSDSIKKFSHMLSDVERIMLDEFQSENNRYCPNEVEKVISIHTSIARGGGKSVRYVPLFLIGNPVTLLNPYYTELGISERLKKDTKFLRGRGYVLEQSYNEFVGKAQTDSGFNKAFRKNRYTAYSTEARYLEDSESFIEKVDGRSTYLATLKYDGKEYAVRSYNDLGIIYVDKRIDETFKMKVSVSTKDHEVNYVMLKRNDAFFSQLRYFFNKGCFRFKDLECKNVIIKALSY